MGSYLNCIAVCMRRSNRYQRHPFRSRQWRRLCHIHGIDHFSCKRETKQVFTSSDLSPSTISRHY
ncbi:MAG: hypothetical protein JRE58_03265 [Deltaproteobacteria bacterium]|nr:hypothetical protein [Deltaproteobacteria bacterium]